MATWEGKPIIASVDVPENGWMTSKDCTFRWTYQTTADSLCVFEDDEIIAGGDYERARLLWVLLDDWARRYMGEHEMNLLRTKYGTKEEV